jgi:TRAP-type C4-dicarboxylate transport system substrate-binding protein
MTRSICIAVVLLVSSFAAEAAAQTTLKMATLAPERSPWDRVFQLWSKSVERSTNGAVAHRRLPLVRMPIEYKVKQR